MFHDIEINNKFLKSALNSDLAINTNEEIISWLYKRREQIHTKITEIPLKDLKQWEFREDNGYLIHKSGKFFSIEGIRVNTNFGLKTSWDQPIINQPEIGFLGILTKQINGVLHFLLQAKIEPGNINFVQLSPTLQATRSNYTRVHKGKTPAYFEYFVNNNKAKVLIDQLQSEQGARFFKKRNRNIIIEVDKNEAIEVYDDFIWVTLAQLKEFMSMDNLVNMDTRTVVSSITYGSYRKEVIDLISSIDKAIGLKNERKRIFLSSILNGESSYFSMDQIFSWITSLKFKYELNIEKINMNEVNNWVNDGIKIKHINNKYFSVIGIDIQIGNREVVSWDQPVIKPSQEGIIGFIIKQINGVYHFLMQAKVEVGNFDILELAPSVQCLTGNYREGENEYSVPFIDIFLNVKEENIWHKSYQSEEGGRFFQEQNLNIIIEVGDEFPIELPENYTWMTLNQLMIFMKFNNYLNIASRSLISLIAI